MWIFNGTRIYRIERIYTDFVSPQYFGTECVALTQYKPNFPDAPGQCDGLPRFIEQIPDFFEKFGPCR